jgi:microcystin-dependent protein
MSDNYVAEIRLFPGNFAPKGWALCNGQLMPISQNTALFSLLGTFYGGNGTSNFALPDFRSRMPMHQGQGPGLSPRSVGEVGGAETITLQGLAIPSTPPAPTTTVWAGFRPQPLTVSPFLVLTFIIALQGIFPARS